MSKLDLLWAFAKVCTNTFKMIESYVDMRIADHDAKPRKITYEEESHRASIRIEVYTRHFAKLFDDIMIRMMPA